MGDDIKTRKQAEEFLIRKASQDDGFRQRLKADPKAVISSELGVTFADNFKITVVEESDAGIYLVLPPRAAPQGHRELADDELAEVAGGGLIGMEGANQEKARGGVISNPTSVRPTLGKAI